MLWPVWLFTQSCSTVQPSDLHPLCKIYSQLKVQLLKIQVQKFMYRILLFVHHNIMIQIRHFLFFQTNSILPLRCWGYLSFLIVRVSLAVSDLSRGCVQCNTCCFMSLCQPTTRTKFQTSLYRPAIEKVVQNNVHHYQEINQPSISTLALLTLSARCLMLFDHRVWILKKLSTNLVPT